MNENPDICIGEKTDDGKPVLYLLYPLGYPDTDPQISLLDADGNTWRYTFEAPLSSQTFPVLLNGEATEDFTVVSSNVDSCKAVNKEGQLKVLGNALDLTQITITAGDVTEDLFCFTRHAEREVTLKSSEQEWMPHSLIAVLPAGESSFDLAVSGTVITDGAEIEIEVADESICTAAVQQDGKIVLNGLSNGKTELYVSCGAYNATFHVRFWVR